MESVAFSLFNLVFLGPIPLLRALKLDIFIFVDQWAFCLDNKHDINEIKLCFLLFQQLSPVTTTAAVSPVTDSDPPAAVKALRVTDLTPPGAYSASNLKWLHTSPICSPTAEHPLSPRDRDLTQDNSVSSSTDGHTKTGSVPRGPLPGKINAPCLERLLKSTESIITRKGAGGLMDSSWS